MRYWLFKTKPSSSLGIKYPTLRDHPLHTGYKWLEGKRADDGAEGLWRIHNNLYDLNKFIASHPGGSEWLELTRGTDITEAFECHHIGLKAEKLLPKFFVKTVETPRSSPFTFEDDGFYRTLKRNIREELGTIDGTKQILKSKIFTDGLLGCFLILVLLAAYFRNFFIGILAGIALSYTGIAAHNYFHQKDNFRRHYFGFTMMQSREWRISHALSHHLYPNTINDMEISSLEPFLQYLPVKKRLRYLSWFTSPIVYSLMFFAHFAKTSTQIIIARDGFSFELFLPFLLPILMILATSGQSIFLCILMFIWIELVGSLHFGAVGVSAAHHHPDIFHDGDKPRPPTEMDWGIYEIDAVMDRKDITGSSFLVLTHFGDHALHHLFPTVDHGVLYLLYPVFLKTCEQFGIEWKLSTQFDLVKGQFQQLAKVEPSTQPPKGLLKKCKVLEMEQRSK